MPLYFIFTVLRRTGSYRKVYRETRIPIRDEPYTNRELVRNSNLTYLTFISLPFYDLICRQKIPTRDSVWRLELHQACSIVCCLGTKNVPERINK